MFVKIKNCYPVQYTHDLERLRAIQSFLEAHGEQKHIIYCKKAVCNDVINNISFGAIHQKYASNLLEYKNEIGTLKQTFKVVLSIFFDSDEEYIKGELNDNVFEITASYHFLLRDSFKNKCIFLAEDESDCDFYTLIAKTVSNIQLGNKISISFNKLEGGGSRTHKKYVNMLSNNDFGICIVDNDKKHPSGSEGDTSKAFKPTLNQRGFAVNQECIVLDFHEAESIIPHEILSVVIDQSKVDTLDKMKNNDQDSSYQFRRYFDHKNGIELSKGWDLDNRYNKSFWQPFFSKERFYQTKPCRKTSRCVDKTQCNSCIKIDGLGDKILVDSISQMEKVHLRSVYNRLTPQIQSQWDYVGQKLIDWGCILHIPSIKSF